MLRRCFGNNRKAQVFLEYTMIIGVIMLVLFAMSPMVKRGIQGMVKVVADQVGNQENAEQRFDDSGHLENAYISTRGVMDRTTRELIGVTNYIFGDTVSTESTTISNLGFTEED